MHIDTYISAAIKLYTKGEKERSNKILKYIGLGKMSDYVKRTRIEKLSPEQIPFFIDVLKSLEESERHKQLMNIVDNMTGLVVLHKECYRAVLQNFKEDLIKISYLV